MPRGGLMFLRCVPAAVTAQAVCVLFMLLALSLPSLQSVTASTTHLQSRGFRGDNNARFSLAEDKARAGASAGGASGSKDEAPAAKPSDKAPPQPEGKAAPAAVPEKKELAPTAPTSPKAEPTKANESSGKQADDQKIQARTTPAAVPTASSVSPSGQDTSSGGTKDGKENVESSPNNSQDKENSGANTEQQPSGSSPSTGPPKPPTPAEKPSDSNAGHTLRGPITATLALALWGCAVTVL